MKKFGARASDPQVAVPAPFDGQLLREVVDPALGREVAGGAVLRAGHAEDRRQVDDAAAAPAQHLGSGGPRHVEQPDEVGHHPGQQEENLVAVVSGAGIVFAGAMASFGVTPNASQGDPARWADPTRRPPRARPDRRARPRPDRRRGGGADAAGLPAGRPSTPRATCRVPRPLGRGRHGRGVSGTNPTSNEPPSLPKAATNPRRPSSAASA